MPPDSRFQEAALTVFEVGYRRSRRKYQRAAGTLQIHASGFQSEHGVEGFDFGYQFHVAESQARRRGFIAVRRLKAWRRPDAGLQPFERFIPVRSVEPGVDQALIL